MFSLDANVLVYAFDATAGHRHARALEILAASRMVDCHLTIQAVGEFFVASRRIDPQATETLAVHATNLLEMFPAVMPSAQAASWALSQAAAGRLQYWDALLLATLREAGCTVLLSEDMQHGADYDGVRVLNPFQGEMLAPEIQTLLITD